MLSYLSFPLFTTITRLGDFPEMEEKINRIEKELEEQRMEIRNVTISASADHLSNEYFLYSRVHHSKNFKPIVQMTTIFELSS
jgi:hypothetical protein